MIRISQQPPTLFHLTFPEWISSPSTVLLNCCDLLLFFSTSLTVLIPLQRETSPSEDQVGTFYFPERVSCHIWSSIECLSAAARPPARGTMWEEGRLSLLYCHTSCSPPLPKTHFIAGFTVKVDDITRDLKPDFKPFLLFYRTPFCFIFLPYFGTTCARITNNDYSLMDSRSHLYEKEKKTNHKINAKPNKITLILVALAKRGLTSKAEQWRFQNSRPVVGVIVLSVVT